jgi:photosystem II stability/assembly factor-like uncharacterized protein
MLPLIFKYLRVNYRRGMRLTWVCLISLLLAGPSLCSKQASAHSAPLPQAVPFFQAAGYFDTTFLPTGGSLHAAVGGDLFVAGSDQIYRSANEGHSWLYSPIIYYLASVSAFAISPNYDLDGTIFKGGNYGTDALMISRDRGKTWQTPYSPVIGPVWDIDVSPGYATDQTVYIVTNDYAKVWLSRSTDGGRNFAPVTLPPTTSQIRKLILSPDFPTDHKIFALLYNQTIWRSLNGGNSWERADSGLLTNQSQAIYDLEITPADGGFMLFAPWTGGLKFSQNSGNSWTSIPLPNPRPELRDVEVAYSTAEHHVEIFAMEGTDGDYFHGLGLFHTINFGSFWDAFVFNNLISNVEISPQYAQNQTVYFKTANELWTTSNHGIGWSLLSSVPPKPPADYDDFDQLELVKSPDFDGVSHLFAYPADVGSSSYPVQGSSWFLRSLDNGENWESLPLPAYGEPVNIVVTPTYPLVPTIYAGIGQNFYRSDDAGETWTLVSGNLGFAFEFLDISPIFNLDHTLYAGSHDNGVFRSQDGGANWIRLSSLGNFVYGIDYSPTYAQDHTIFINSSGGIHRSQDGGQTWESIGMEAMILAVSPNFAADGTLFAGNRFSTAGNLYRSTDRGDNWEELTGFNPYDFFHTIAISPDYADDQTLVIGINCRPLYISEDAGVTWYEMTGIPTPCGYGASADVVLTHQGELLQPVVSTQFRVFSYHWPQDVEVHPTRLAFLVRQGSSTPVQRHLEIASQDAPGARWEIEESLDWISADPVSGTLPGEVVLTVDPSSLMSNMDTNIQLMVHWSQRQVVRVSIPVWVLIYNNQRFLPVVSSRN